MSQLFDVSPVDMVLAPKLHHRARYSLVQHTIVSQPGRVTRYLAYMPDLLYVSLGKDVSHF